MAIAYRKRLAALAAGAAIALFLGLCYSPTVVMGHSMAPTLKPGQVIWIDRFAYVKRLPRAGEVVVFRWQGQTYVKRVYRGPDEEMKYIGRGAEVMRILSSRVADKLQERYRKDRVIYCSRIPDDRVFVLGDNYDASIDSRLFGAVPVSCILGRARVPASLEPLEQFEYSKNPPPLPAKRRTQPKRTELARSDVARL